MKKKLILTISIVLVFVLTMFIVMQNDEKVIYESGVHSIEVADALAMMYETEFGSGEYVVSDDTTWPLEGYVFNAELSRCENGSTLYWDEETKSVMMEANVSDKCYIYFDKENPYLIVDFINNGSGRLYLNSVNITDQINENIAYEIGDILSYTHFQQCSERGLKIYNEYNELIKQISSSYGNSYEDIVLTGEERYIEEYTEGFCEPYGTTTVS